MCGRYAFFTDRELAEIDEILDKIDQDLNRDKMKTGEIFPTDLAPVLVPGPEPVTPKLMKWGFPGFTGKGVIINARSETAWDKKMFASSLRERRCAVPTTGFYEWDKEKNKFIFNMPDSGVLYLAGLYNRFEGEDRFVILTRNAQGTIAGVHDRMPVILPKRQISDWLADPGLAVPILGAAPPELTMESA